MTINRSTMKTNKQMLEDVVVVMVKELLEETELPDMDNKMPCYKFSGHQMMDNQ